MNDSQTFNTLEVNKIKTNKLEYSYSNNVIYINKINSNQINLDHTYSNYYLITQDNSMDIDITLSSRVIGTKFRIFITNVQNKFKLRCNYSLDRFKGVIKLNNNSSTVNQDTLNNNLKKKITHKSDSSEIIYIPNKDLGLYNGGYIDLLYIGNESNNTPIGSHENGFWLVYGDLIGVINIPRSITPLSTSRYLLTIYILPTNNTIICVTTTNPINKFVYFNKVNNNNISIFQDLAYDINIVDATTNTDNILYNSTTYNSNNLDYIYNIEICNNLLTTNTDTFISLSDLNTNVQNANTLSFINEFSTENDKYNISETYNEIISNYNKLNIIKYNIKNNNIIKIQGFFNIISIKSYNNSESNPEENILPSLLFGIFNIFTFSNNNIKLDYTLD